MVGAAILVYCIRIRENRPLDIVEKKEKKIEEEMKKANTAIKEHNEQLKEHKKEAKEKPDEEVIKGFNNMFGSSNNNDNE